MCEYLKVLTQSLLFTDTYSAGLCCYPASNTSPLLYGLQIHHIHRTLRCNTQTNMGFIDFVSSRCMCLICWVQWLIVAGWYWSSVNATVGCIQFFGTANTATLCSKTDGAACDCSSALQVQHCPRVAPHCKKYHSSLGVFSLNTVFSVTQTVCGHISVQAVSMWHHPLDADYVMCQL